MGPPRWGDRKDGDDGGDDDDDDDDGMVELGWGTVTKREEEMDEDNPF
jgi:hypothetical protein